MTKAMGKARAKSVMEVHAVNRYYKTFTYCHKDVSQYPTAEGDAVTCDKCQYALQVAAAYDAYYEAHPAERGWMWAGMVEAAGIKTVGPQNGSRQRPDGKLLRWQALRIEQSTPLVPFFIQWEAGSPHPSSDSPRLGEMPIYCSEVNWRTFL